MMRSIFKIIVVIVLIYAVTLTLITSFFDFLNKSAAISFWTTAIENDLPNLIALIAMIYLIVKILASLRKD